MQGGDLVEYQVAEPVHDQLLSTLLNDRRLLVSDCEWFPRELTVVVSMTDRSPCVPIMPHVTTGTPRHPLVGRDLLRAERRIPFYCSLCSLLNVKWYAETLSPNVSGFHFLPKSHMTP